VAPEPTSSATQKIVHGSVARKATFL
jgi:hypothetical protein